MLYVNDTEKIANFLIEELGFMLKDKVFQNNYYIITLKDQRANGTELVLHNKESVKKMNTGVNLEMPSLLLMCDDDIEIQYQKLKNNGVIVGDLVVFPNTKQRVFNFADPENNYYALMEK